MTEWSQGYVSDVPYSLGFFREVTPANLGFASLSVGRKYHGPSGAAKRVLELGFGRGLTINVLAAANPGMVFEGVDFNPAHVLEASALATRASLKNVSIREASFEDVAAEAVENQHDLDIIILHGILSWVGPSAQRAIVEVARKRLKPGGLLYASYNCMPGWAPTVPLQRLMREYASRIPSRSDKRMAAAMQFASDLASEGALYFSANPSVMQRINGLSKMDRNYVVHEYLVAHWNIFYFPEIADLFRSAKLDYIGSAAVTENVNLFTVPEKMQQRLSEIDDVVFQELVRDFASNRQFRRDIFCRGALAMTAGEQNAAIGEVGFALTVPTSRVKSEFQTLLGQFKADSEHLLPITNLLAKKIATFDEIAALPELRNQKRAALLVSLALLVQSGQVIPILGAPQVNTKSVKIFNQTIVNDFKCGRPYRVLASPAGGTGIGVSQGELIALSAHYDGQAKTPAEAARYGLGILRNLNLRLIKDGNPIEDEDKAIAELEPQVAKTYSEVFPIWRRLGVLE